MPGWGVVPGLKAKPKPAAKPKKAVKTKAPRTSDPMSGPTVTRVVHQQKVNNPRSVEHYRAAKQRWNHTAPVKNAKRDMRAAQREFQHGNRKLAKVMMTTAGNKLENERQRLDSVAEPVYKAYMDRLWEETKHDFRGHRPGAVIVPPEELGDGGAYADAPRGMNHVRYSIGAMRDYVNRGEMHDFAKGAPLHEWAHLRQNHDTYKSKGLTEGGADAYAQSEERKLGMPVTHAPAYDAYRRAVQKRSKHYVRHEQFLTAKQIRDRDRERARAPKRRKRKRWHPGDPQ